MTHTERAAALLDRIKGAISLVDVDGHAVKAHVDVSAATVASVSAEFARVEAAAYERAACAAEIAFRVGDHVPSSIRALAKGG